VDLFKRERGFDRARSINSGHGRRRQNPNRQPGEDKAPPATPQVVYQHHAPSRVPHLPKQLECLFVGEMMQKQGAHYHIESRWNVIASYVQAEEFYVRSNHGSVLTRYRDCGGTHVSAANCQFQASILAAPP
jgi:hypothetical protein